MLLLFSVSVIGMIYFGGRFLLLAIGYDTSTGTWSWAAVQGAWINIFAIILILMVLKSCTTS